MSAFALFLLFVPPAVLAGDAPAGQQELTQAYDALRAKDYDAAIDAFRKGIKLQPANASVHKDLAYTLLKAGDNAAARDEFQAALKLNPQDETAALEFAFLSFETKKPIEARRMFDKLRKNGATAATRQTAEQAFQNIDQPLKASIARWTEAIARSPKPNDLTMFSAHWELAQTAELRDELTIAAHEYEICRQLKPQMSEFLLDLARVWQEIDRGDEAQAALLAASRSSDSRTAEQALEIYGNRYPYPYEFISALKIDPGNTNLRRELGFLYLAMNDKAKATEQFEMVLSLNPKDRLAREQLDALHGFKTRAQYVPHTADSGFDPKAMGLKSLSLGYSNDAIKYLLQAIERDPHDAEVMLKLGWAYNAAHRDDEAKAWFEKARHAEDKQIAAEATKAFHNLNGDIMPQTTVWALPMYSTRWHDFFTYGQIKRTIPIPGLGRVNKLVSFYVSTRFTGDVKSGILAETSSSPLYLSESAFIVGLGATSKTWHRLTGWVEAGESIKYVDLKNIGAAVPDYRGGVNYAKGFGSLAGSSKGGFYYETTGDAIYVSRFGKDWLFYSQNRSGRTIPIGEGNTLQLLMNGNVVTDAQHQYWANTLEFGPGVRFRPYWMPKNVYFSGDFLRGIYLMNSPRPDYFDFRLGFWYAKTTK